MVCVQLEIYRLPKIQISSSKPGMLRIEQIEHIYPIHSPSWDWNLIKRNKSRTKIQLKSCHNFSSFILSSDTWSPYVGPGHMHTWGLINAPWCFIPSRILIGCCHYPRSPIGRMWHWRHKDGACALSSPYLENSSCLGISGIFSYITFRLNLYMDMKTCLHNAALLKCEDIPHIFLSTKTLFYCWWAAR